MDLTLAKNKSDKNRIFKLNYLYTEKAIDSFIKDTIKNLKSVEIRNRWLELAELRKRELFALLPLDFYNQYVLEVRELDSSSAVNLMNSFLEGRISMYDFSREVCSPSICDGIRFLKTKYDKCLANGYKISLDTILTPNDVLYTELMQLKLSNNKEVVLQYLADKYNVSREALIQTLFMFLPYDYK